MGVVAWSPLANGFLTGKYTRDGDGEGRLTRGWPGNEPARSEHDWAILDAVLAAAGQTGTHPAQTALNWVAGRPGVAATLIGATSVAQLDQNIAALDAPLPHEVVAALDRASAVAPVMFPHNIFARFPVGSTRRRPTSYT
jgi:aryl-alcohol dehydrogenase-like predicted oxidoreductase